MDIKLGREGQQEVDKATIGGTVRTIHHQAQGHRKAGSGENKQIYLQV